MYASVLPGLVSQNQLDLALDIFENLCKAPAAVDNRLNIFQQAQRLFEAVAHAPLLQAKARRVLAAVRPTRALHGDQERTLSMLVTPTPGFLPQVTPVKEFTPGMMWQPAEWEAYQDDADRYSWMQWSQHAEEWGTAPQITPPRSNVRMLEKDENASPNVMQILLQSDAASGEKMPARQKKKETPESSPQKGSKPTGPLEFSVPAQPVGVLVEKNTND